MAVADRLAPMTQVAILWHMHQPFYEDLVTHEHILPWVRLHAIKDYYGMAALLREFPDVRVTFNLVPSLLVQLEAFAGDRARDRHLETGLKPAAELTEGDIAFILEHFFHAQRERLIEGYPRYAELLAMRGGPAPTPSALRAAAARFSVDDLRDLQVWHKLAWIDPSYHEHDARVRALLQKGRHFSEDDKAVLRAVELEILNRVIPEYADAAARAQIELCTSPFYHPILPLLCDTDIYLANDPHARMPRHRFQHPEDAAEQLARAVDCHQRLFGRRPEGLWPSEGSVSDAMVPLAAAAGFQWMATDEQILARTTGADLSRDSNGQLHQPEHLYRAYRVEARGSSVACAFRDHALSDLIGFIYAGWAPADAAGDFVARLTEAGRRFRERSGGEEAVISIILDGENAWEHFEGGGRPFLRALYRRLSDTPDLRTVTMSEATRRPNRTLGGIFPGSWIDSNFYIWIGHPDDQQAWNQLAEAREAFSAAAGSAVVDPAQLAQAREELLIAEGSDWCWWYGDDHSSDHDLAFDDLFRRHLRNVYRLLGRPIPDDLFISNISSAMAVAQDEPSALIAPALDGEQTSYFEWLGAGTYEVRDAAGAMHQTGRRASLVTLIHFGFDRERLYVRVDAGRRLIDLLAEGFEVSLKFLQPDAVRFSVRQTLGRLTGHYWDRHGAAGPGGVWTERGAGGAAVAAGSVLEIALPLTDLRVAAADPLAFFVAVYDSASVEVERHPAHRPIDVQVPDALFEARNWNA